MSFPGAYHQIRSPPFVPGTLLLDFSPRLYYTIGARQTTPRGLLSVVCCFGQIYNYVGINVAVGRGIPLLRVYTTIISRNDGRGVLGTVVTSPSLLSRRTTA